jgi:hypothetical protein
VGSEKAALRVPNCHGLSTLRDGPTSQSPSPDFEWPDLRHTLYLEGPDTAKLQCNPYPL